MQKGSAVAEKMTGKAVKMRNYALLYRGNIVIITEYDSMRLKITVRRNYICVRLLF
jgi:hypothetical protein